MKHFFSSSSIFLLLLLNSCEIHLYSQNKTDSLRKALFTAKEDTIKINILTALALEYKGSNPDTSLVLINKAFALCEKLSSISSSKMGTKEEEAIGRGRANALRIKGLLNWQQANYTEAQKYYFESLKFYEKLNDKKGIATTLGNIGLIYWNQADYPQALDYYFRALKMDEELENKNGVARHLSNIGVVYEEQADHPQALGYYFRALKMNEELENKIGTAITLGNIGLVYADQADYPKALDYYFRALKMDEELGNKNGVARHLGNIGNVYADQADYPKALDYYFRALKMDEELGNKNGVARHLGNIGNLYIKSWERGVRSLEAKDENDALLLTPNSELLTKAEQYLKKSLMLADTIGYLEETRVLEKLYSELDSIKGDYKGSLEHYKKFITVRDAIDNDEKKKQQLRTEAKFEFEKKEVLMKEQQAKERAVTEEKSRKEKVIRYSVSGGLVLMFAIAVVIFRSLRVTRKQKQIIEVQKNEVSQQKEIVEKQKEIVEKQKHIVEEKQKEIVDSITYARRIQRALLTSDEYIKNNLPAEHFILFKPKDIVSGDFYWAYRSADALFYIATADCTGHGVPGAFMSMLNISYLNENVIERGIRLPHDILNAQRTEIIKALNPPESKEVSKDGMDCILCAYDFNKMLLHFAAANNPLWLVRKKGSDFELIEYKADKMPVGKYTEEMLPFNLQTIELQKGDIIYASTDGYADQFGGNGRKLMKKNFKEELLKIHHLSMTQQKEHLDAFFESWKGNTEQLDDVCVIGVRV